MTARVCLRGQRYSLAVWVSQGLNSVCAATALQILSSMCIAWRVCCQTNFADWADFPTKESLRHFRGNYANKEVFDAFDNEHSVLSASLRSFTQSPSILIALRVPLTGGLIPRSFDKELCPRGRLWRFRKLPSVGERHFKNFHTLERGDSRIVPHISFITLRGKVTILPAAI